MEWLKGLLPEGTDDEVIKKIASQIGETYVEKEKLKEFIASQSIPYTILNSEPVPKTPLGPVPALPTTYIIDPEGRVIAGEIGLVPSEALEDFITKKKEQRNTRASSSTVQLAAEFNNK